MYRKTWTYLWLKFSRDDAGVDGRRGAKVPEQGRNEFRVCFGEPPVTHTHGHMYLGSANNDNAGRADLAKGKNTTR